MHDRDSLSSPDFSGSPDALSSALVRRLRALSPEMPEPYGWEEFLRRAASRGRQVPVLGMTAAAAAVLLVVVGAVAAWVRHAAPPAEEASAAAPSVAVERAADRPELKGGAHATAETGAAAPAERWLVSLPPDPAVVRVGGYAAVAGLEDRIAQLDDLMTAARAHGIKPASLSALERQRARLVSSLAQVRYAEALASDSPP